MKMNDYLSTVRLHLKRMKPFVDWHVNTLGHTFFVICFTIAPLIYGIIKVLFFSELESMQPFYINGDFFLYAISLMSSAYITFSINYSKRFFSGFWNSISIMVLFLASICYVVLSTGIDEPKAEIIRIFSYVFFTASVVMFYFSQFVVTRRSPDIGKNRKGEQELIIHRLS